MAPRSNKTTSKSDQNKGKSGPRNENMKKSKKTPKDSFKSYIFKILKVVEPGAGINQKAMNVSADFLEDMLVKIASEAGRLRKKAERRTMTKEDITAAIKLTMPPELASEAISASRKALRDLKASHS